MKGWTCDGCGADFKQEKKPEHCLICFKRQFSEQDFEDPTETDKHVSEKYKKVLNKLEEYEEGCSPRSAHDHICCCGSGCGSCEEEKPKKEKKKTVTKKLK